MFIYVLTLYHSSMLVGKGSIINYAFKNMLEVILIMSGFGYYSCI